MLAMGINNAARRAIEIIPFLDMFKFSVFSLFCGQKLALIIYKYLQEKGNRVFLFRFFYKKRNYK